MSLDAMIDAAIAGGRFAAASAFAAEFINPAAHLAAMIRINAAMRQPQLKKDRPIMLQLTAQAAKLSNWNPSPEMHGPDPKPAGDVTLIINAASSKLLPMLDPMLRGFLFHKNGAVQHDLADETADAPDLRFPKMPGPLAWFLPMEGATLTIHVGDREDSKIVLPATVKAPLKLTPMQGGTVMVTLQARCHPDKEQAGALYELMGNSVTVSFDPGNEIADDLVGQAEGPQ